MRIPKSRKVETKQMKRSHPLRIFLTRTGANLEEVNRKQKLRRLPSSLWTMKATNGSNLRSLSGLDTPVSLYSFLSKSSASSVTGALPSTGMECLLILFKHQLSQVMTSTEMWFKIFTLSSKTSML
jgi:hypothetical protein